MTWLTNLFTDERSIATCLLILALTIAAGLALGKLRFRGIQLGVAGVLFSGLIFGHFGLNIDPHALEFAREFGLVLFVYAVGLAVGPGFFNAFRKYGLKTNAYAVVIVLAGTVTAGLACWLGGMASPIAVGVLSGATTSTSSISPTTCSTSPPW